MSVSQGRPAFDSIALELRHLTRQKVLARPGLARARLSRRARDLERSLAKVADEIPISASMTPLRVSVVGTPRALRPIFRDEVYRIGRGAVLNATRVGGATRIEVELAYDDEGLRMRIRDDRIRPLRAEDPDPGRRLRAMIDRAESIGAQLAVTSTPGAGTELVLLVPPRLGFEPSPPNARRFLGARSRRFVSKADEDETRSAR
jgi:signal transduction histidine kinase